MYYRWLSIILSHCSVVISLFPHSKHLPDDWLERMYHSCQHRHPPIPETLDHPEMHPMLMSYLVSQHYCACSMHTACVCCLVSIPKYQLHNSISIYVVSFLFQVTVPAYMYMYLAHAWHSNYVCTYDFGVMSERLRKDTLFTASNLIVLCTKWPLVDQLCPPGLDRVSLIPEPTSLNPVVRVPCEHHADSPFQAVCVPSFSQQLSVSSLSVFC